MEIGEQGRGVEYRQLDLHDHDALDRFLGHHAAQREAGAEPDHRGRLRVGMEEGGQVAEQVFVVHVGRVVGRHALAVDEERPVRVGIDDRHRRAPTLAVVQQPCPVEPLVDVQATFAIHDL